MYTTIFFGKHEVSYVFLNIGYIADIITGVLRSASRDVHMPLFGRKPLQYTLWR